MRLQPIQSALTGVLELFGLKWGGGFVLSPAVVPVIEVSRLLQVPRVPGLFDFENAVGPHGVTVRWEYTVPAGSRAVIESLSLNALRVAAGGVVGRVRAEVLLSHAAGGGGIVGRVEFIDNAVGARSAVMLGGPITMQAGDNIACSTSDFSTTTSSVEYGLTAHIREF